MRAEESGKQFRRGVSWRGMALQSAALAIFALLLSAPATLAPAQLKVSVYAPSTPDVNFWPEELAFGPQGQLYAGHQFEGAASYVYRIPAGGGIVENFGGNNMFDDPDGIDVDIAGNIWVSSGRWDHAYTGEIFRVTPAGAAQPLGANYLKNPTSLEIDRAGRFGHPGAIVVGSALGPGSCDVVHIIPTWPQPVTTVMWTTTTFRVIRNLRFDADGNLWFIAEDVGRLYKWAPGGAPRPVPIPGATGALLGLCLEPEYGTLLIGLYDQGRVVRIQTDGSQLQVFAEDVTARSIVKDADGYIYISDQQHHVIWKFAPVRAKSRHWTLYR